MQRSAATPTQPAAPFFSSLFGFGGGTGSNSKSQNSPPSPADKTQRPTSSGQDLTGESPRQRKTLVKERKPSLGRKSSFVFLSSPPGKKSRHRADSAASSHLASPVDGGGAAVPLPTRRPSAIRLAPEETAPPLPDLSPRTTDGFSRMLSRGAPTPTTGYPAGMAGPGVMHSSGSAAQQSELGLVHQHIQETVNKRISTLDYLRKAHEGRIYWFNTLLFDKPDLQRMPYFDQRKLGRRATNYLLLGISLPAVLDLNSGTPAEFLRALNTLLAEFDTFQQIHNENGVAASSLTRTRIPQMFRRAAAPVSKGRRSSSATAGRDGGDSASAATGGGGGGGGGSSGIGYALEQVESNTASISGGIVGGGAGGGGGGGTATPIPGAVPSSSAAASGAGAGAGAGPAEAPPGCVISFGAGEVDLLPGEEYTHLLTPTLPFDPDFFETFATLCDVLIDTYARLLSLVPTPRECAGAVPELFAKADSKIKKLFIQSAIREFEEAGRAGIKGEVASVGKVVLSGLM
ncbi:hypothetical protein VTH06DRAFT_5186 [Thermothelomyces fergusii]